MTEPAEARPSSTVIVARAAGREPELLMVKRHEASSFGGAWVFPGGVVDSDDELVAARQDALTTDAANSILGVESGGLGYFSAALRELFEETGVLLADPVPSDVGALRAGLLDGSRNWAELVAQHQIALRLSGLHYVSFWITPEALPKRYSTRFFVAEAPQTSVASACGGEVLDCRWLTARSALESAEQGGIKLHFPTRITLEALAEHGSVRDLLRWARGCAEAGVPCIFPERPSRDAVLDAVAKRAAIPRKSVR